jgi:hypothetical protein
MKPMIGATYPTVTGENTPKGAAFSRIMQELPGLQMWSVYYSGTALPNWTSTSEPWFNAEHTGIRWYLLSIKSSDLTAISNCLGQMPTHLRGRIMVFLHHEPDQWRSATDPRSDPSPQVWQQRQEVFATMRVTAPWGPWIEHWACFTEDRLRTDRTEWMYNWGNWMLDNQSVFDGVAWDVFNIGRSVIRSGQDMFSEITAFNGYGGWPLVVREWGQVTPTDSPVDSQAVANAVVEHYDWCLTNTQLPFPIRGLVWYYNYNNTLTDPSGVLPGRPLTLAAIRECLTIALTPEENEEVPDPTDPQYLFGYNAGQASRQPEVDSLVTEVQVAVSQISALNSQLASLETEVNAAHNEGRHEAFQEVLTWIEGKA